MKTKKPHEYMNVKDTFCYYMEKGKEYRFYFPATKERKEFKLPWRVKGSGLKEKLV